MCSPCRSRLAGHGLRALAVDADRGHKLACRRRLFAGRIAFRITGGAAAPAERSVRRFAAVRRSPPRSSPARLVLGIEGYMHYVLSAQSDPDDRHLLPGGDRHVPVRTPPLVARVRGPRALGRPEVWPFLGVLHGLGLAQRPLHAVAAGAAIALIAFMWFGIPWITNGRPNIAGELAPRSPRELHENKVFGTIGRFTELQYLPLWIAGSRHGRHRPRAPPVAGAGLGRRDRGVSAHRDRVRVPRLPGALALHVRAGRRGRGARGNRGRVDVGRPPGTGATAPRRGRGVPRWARVAAVALLVVALVPGAAGRCEPSAPTCGYKGRDERDRAAADGDTSARRLPGDPRLRGAGHRRRVREPAGLGHPSRRRLRRVPTRLREAKENPTVLLPIAPGGWRVQPWHTRRLERGRCSDLLAAYVLTKRNPDGVLIHGRGAGTRA